jgi:hypothetical protein
MYIPHLKGWLSEYSANDLKSIQQPDIGVQKVHGKSVTEHVKQFNITLKPYQTYSAQSGKKP